MPKRTGQAEASLHIRELLRQRGFDIAARTVTHEDKRQWLVFERAGRQVGVDLASGLWVKPSPKDTWRCIERSCTVGGALEAVDFLTRSYLKNRL
ncbi:MAG TPA: hypothetical protein VF131_21170 [Blastocatellia bacterium]|nr:hypothetical protein [Blastocatellia bacterium]